MKDVLPEYYGPDEEAIKAILTTGTVALDANALLDLYRVNRAQREEILSVLQTLRQRIFIPYQAALEFQRNRLKVVADNQTAHEQLEKTIKFEEETWKKLHDPVLRTEVRRQYDQLHEEYRNRLEAIRKEHALDLDDIRKHDPVREALDTLLGPESVGAPPAEEVLKQRKSEAETRNKAKIPPGFADSENKDDASGDYLIWAELLTHAQKFPRPMLFVTNDANKGDWYQPKLRGRSMGPRIELVVEMQAAAPSSQYHQVTLGTLLYLAKQHLGASVEESTIESVRRISQPSATELTSAEAWSALERLTLRDPKSSRIEKRMHYLLENPEPGADLNYFLQRKGMEAASAFQDWLRYAGTPTDEASAGTIDIPFKLLRLIGPAGVESLSEQERARLISLIMGSRRRTEGESPKEDHDDEGAS